MAVLFNLLKNNNEKMATAYGKWYARPVAIATRGIDDIADLIQRNCTVKKSDCKAVLTELGEVVKDMLQAGYRVNVEGLGSFKIGLSSKGVADVKDYNVATDITNVRVIFQPEVTVDSATKKRTKVLTDGIKFQNIASKASEAAVVEINKKDTPVEP